MKYNVKITNLSFDVEVTPIDNTTSTSTSTSTSTTSSSTTKAPEVFDLDAFLSGKSGVVRLPSEMNNREVVVKSKGMIAPGKVTALIGKSTLITFQSWEETPTQLFNLNGCSEFGIVGITFLAPPNRPIKTGFPDKEVFGWERDRVVSGKFAYIDNQEIIDRERVTFGLARFAYSSTSTSPIYLIGKDLHHNGFNFTQLKNPYNGNLNLILQNVKVYNPILIDQGGPDSAPSSMFYCPTAIKVRVNVQNGIAKIISDNTFDQILTWVGYNNGNQRSILHFDRYAYDISEGQLKDNKTLSLQRQDINQSISNTQFRSNSEYHPNDLTAFGRITEKQIDESRKTNFVYTVDTAQKGDKITLPTGEYDAYICYKGNALFGSPVTINTKFGDGYWESGVIIQSQGYGWTWYNEEFSGYIENFNGDGYFRNSTGSGVTQGLTIKNSTFQKNAPKATANNPMPQEAKDYIAYLEAEANK